MAALTPSSIDETTRSLADQGYFADRALSTLIFLALRLGRPLYLEGEAGVGKTEAAKALAQSLGCRLLRLQCYEGLDRAAAAYEWNYPRQMLAIRLAEAGGNRDRAAISTEIFGSDFLVARPLLQAITPDACTDGIPPLLLIDELDRADEPFEAFLLEILSDFQITIPELGTIQAVTPPFVVITSNRTREVHDAIKRRCLYHWIDYPSVEREAQILAAKVPQAGARLSREIVAFVQCLRHQDLFKSPGVAETLDWAQALVELEQMTLDPLHIEATLGVLLKYQDDLAKIQGSVAARLLAELKQDLAAHNS